MHTTLPLVANIECTTRMDYIYNNVFFIVLHCLLPLGMHLAGLIDMSFLHTPSIQI